MNFAGLSLSSILTAAGAGIFVISVLYLLKLKRQKVQVPYLALWKKVVRKQEEQSLFQKLKKLLSYLLQLFLWFLLLFALANPLLKSELFEPGHTILILDTSASMLAKEGKTTRFQKAKQRLKKWIQKKGNREKVMILSMNRDTTPATSFLSEKKSLLKALDKLEAVDTSARPIPALLLAKDVLFKKHQGHIIMVSDAVWTSQSYQTLQAIAERAKKKQQQKTKNQTSLPLLPKFELLRIGSKRKNVGIIAFNARRRLDNPLQFSAYIRVLNANSFPIRGRLEMYVDDLVIENIPFRIQANQSWSRIFPRLTARGERLKARIVLPSDVNDFSVDDQAYAVLPKSKPIRVLLVSNDNLYLYAALLTAPGIVFDKIKCSQNIPKRKQFDVFVYNNCSPKKPVSKGNFLFFHPTEKNLPFLLKKKSKKRLKTPIITEVSGSHSIMKFVVLEDVNIGSALAVKRRKKEDFVLASSFGEPIIIGTKKKGLRALMIGFALQQSDLPLRVAFPLFLRNSLRWLHRGERPLAPTTRSTNQRWEVYVGRAKKAWISGPSLSRRPLQVLQERVFFSGKKAGYYKLESEGNKRWVAANLASRSESLLMPPKKRKLHLLIPAPKKSGQALLGGTFFGKKPWFLMVFAAILLFVFEWFTYNRRLTV